jgi:hypothetical protein
MANLLMSNWTASQADGREPASRVRFTGYRKKQTTPARVANTGGPRLAADADERRRCAVLKEFHGGLNIAMCHPDS